MSNVYGIDIGTSNFKMCCKDKDAILNEKNIIAMLNAVSANQPEMESSEGFTIYLISNVSVSVDENGNKSKSLNDRVDAICNQYGFTIK